MIARASQSAFDAQAIPEPEHLAEAKSALNRARAALGQIGWVIQNPPSSYATPDLAEDAVKDAIAEIRLALTDIESHARPAARSGLWRAR